MIKMDYKSLITRILVVIGINFLMSVLLLLTSDSIYIANQRIPSEFIFVSAIIGVIGSILFLMNKTPFSRI